MGLKAIGTRRLIGAGLVCAALVAGGVAVLRSDGVRPTTVRSGPSTRWLVNQRTGFLLLADGLTGRVSVRIGAEANITGEVPVHGAGGTYLVAAAQGAARSVNTSLLQLGTARTVALLSDTGTIVGVGPTGLTVVNAGKGEASLLSSDEARPISVQPADLAAVAADGNIWMLRGGSVDHVFIDGRRVTSRLGIDADLLVTVGDDVVAVDSNGGRLQWIGGAPQSSPIDSPDLVVQESSPSSTCLWLAAGDELACVGLRGVERRLTVDGLAAAPGDSLAVHGRAAAIVRANNRGVQRIDLIESRLVTVGQADVGPTAELQVSVAEDLVWVDDTAGDKAWAVHPFGINVIDKEDTSAPLLDEQGQVTEEGSTGGPGVGGTGPDAPPEERPLDDGNGRDDPPQAIDDAATAREGSALTIPVTSNDFDPDGEGIAVISVTQGGRGMVDIVNASSVVYRPELDYVGTDTFSYTIVDKNGNEDSADVTVELFDDQSPNRAPLSSPDRTSTAEDKPVIVDVLINDVDPERDPLDIASTETPAHGEVTLSSGPSGLPALRYVPEEGFTGTDTFRYIAIDPEQGYGEPTEVTVEVGSLDGTNQPPVARPDAVRLQGEQAVDVAVLLNDTDPDADLLSLSQSELLPTGINVTVKGDQLNIIASAGAPPRAEVIYRIDDGQGHEAFGKVLVLVIEGGDRNSPPLAVADIDRVVAGQSILVPVLANDLDPDGDPLSITRVVAPTDGSATVTVEGDRVRMTPTDTDIDAPIVIQASYTIGDGRGDSDSSTISLTVLPEALPDPPYARDDSATTEQDQPVVIDVLANDGDPSGGEPKIVGSPGCAGGGRVTLTGDDRISFTPPSGETGVFRCRYEVSNDRGLRASAAIIVTVIEPASVNRPPATRELTYNAIAGGPPITFDLRAGVNDPDPGDSFTIRVVRLPPGAVEDDGNITYQAPPNSTGIVSIEYRATDSSNASAGGVVTIRINDPEPQPPVAPPYSRRVESGEPFTIDISTYASDPDGTAAALRIDSIGPVSGGGSMRVGDNPRVLVVDPPETAARMSAQVTIIDPQGLTATGTVTVEVEIPTNRPPVAANDQLAISSGGSGQVNLLTNDSDPDGDPLTIDVSGAGTSALGTVSVSGGVVSFSATPRAEAATLQLDYTISDGEFTDSAVLTIEVKACSDSAPVASSALLFTPYQTPIAIDLNSYATNGTVVDVSGAGFTGATGTYTPPAGFNGNVAVNFSVVNSCRLRASGALTIDVNRDPVGRQVSLSFKRGGYFEIPVNELAGDDEVLTITAANGEPNWVDVAPGLLSGTAPRGGNRSVFSFNVTVQDPGGLTAKATVTLTLLPNEPPVAVDDVLNITTPGPGQIDPIANDQDPDGDNSLLTLRSAQFTSGGGSLSINGRVLTIDADHGYSTITYVVEDPSGDTDTGTISILANQSPNANDVGPVSQDGVVELSAGDPDGDALALVTSNVPPGVLVIVGPNLFMAVQLGTFTGEGSFTYTVTDPYGKSASARVLLSVEPPPDG